ncbi:hypothetical protein CJ209_11525 [Fusobacterium nucleatum]|uniref:Helicase SNF n=1 Tax=Fusobacterium nucleatum TaxID=851 RepID=A0A2N6TEX4_FUSNU|nr:DEAD/DEAH box helicase [Fusobacterium nucleatum]PMC67858.1 hypothetical protein CJ209_11525 [Fusobacterium nucleatum]
MEKKLFFSFDLKKSRDLNLIYLDTFYCPIRLKKNNQFSGILKRYDNKNYNELSLEEKKFLSDLKLENIKNFVTYEEKEIEILKNISLPIFIKEKKNLFLIEKIIKQEKLDKKKYFYINNLKIFFSKGILYYDFSHTNMLQELNKSITPKIEIKIKGISYTKLYFYLEFNYNGEVVKSNESRASLKNKLKRNFTYEKNIENIILDKNFKNSKYNLYEGKFENLEKLNETFNEEDINFYYFEEKIYKKVKIPKFQKIEKNEKGNWISYDIIYQFSKENYSIVDEIDFYQKKWTILKNESLYLLSPKLKKTLTAIENNNLEKEIPWYKKGILSDILKKYGEKITETYSYENIILKLPNMILKILKSYQILGVKWLKYLYLNNVNGCLADDMGLGKTLQVLTFLYDRDVKEKNILIVCPKILVKNWAREITKFKFDFNYNIISSIKDFEIIRLDENKKNILITSFGVIRKLEKEIEKIDFLIVDEAQNIKNFLSLSYQILNSIKVKNRLLLTGTPIENNICELIGLMDFLNPNLFDSKNLIGNKINYIKRMISPFVLRRTKEDVLTLPQKNVENIFLTMQENQTKLYTSLVEKFKKELNEKNQYRVKDGTLFLKMLMILRQVCCHPRILPQNLNPNNINESIKFEKLKEILRTSYLKKQKIIVFSQFTSMLRIIEEYLENENYKYYYLDGQTINREKLLQEYEKDFDFSVFLISLKAGGVGINLISAQRIVIYDPWWNPAVEEQAIDRIYRIGQQKNVEVYKLYIKGTIEEKIYNLKITKNQIFKDLLEKQDSLLSLSEL